MPKRRATTKCRDCGAPIRFVRTSDGRCIPCNAKMIYISPSADWSDVYYRANGTRLTGMRHPDGIGVYEQHNCRCREPIDVEALARAQAEYAASRLKKREMLV